MSIIDDEFHSLTPKASRLQSTIVLAQAWKKTHTYIRRHNWYADTLELDISVVDLESSLAEWVKQIVTADFKPSPLRLVPAPKNGAWEFRSQVPLLPKYFLDLTPDDIGSPPTFHDWKAKKSDTADSSAESSALGLRPLAHLTIRDQTLATAALMCLANIVESAQGDSDDNLQRQRTTGVVSYGNRLQCQWRPSTNGRDLATFSWGSAKTYRKFSEDYRAFLARPRTICAHLAPSIKRGEELYIVSLDIKAFFDSIDIQALQRELRLLEQLHREDFGIPDSDGADEEFWTLTQRIFSWSWFEIDHVNAPLVCSTPQLPAGLPQGLVASGFLANAYMVRFDRELNELIKQKIKNDGFEILDYSRYVDDIRLVVSASSTFGQGQVEVLLESVIKFFEKKLQEHVVRLIAQSPLKLSEKKCTVVPYRSISVKSNVSAMMEVIQAELSGTFDLESLIQTDGGLEGLLRLSEQMDAPSTSFLSRLSLANIALPDTDVRDDTLKRFVAARLVKSLRARLSMSESADASTSSAKTKRAPSANAIAHDFESTARKFLKYWSTNPALAVLLRYALDLFPHPRLLSPVVEALEVKLFMPFTSPSLDALKEVKVCEYLTADLFNAASSDTGYRPLSEYPVGVDITGYREQLSSFAKKILLSRPHSPWYLRQQASLFLATLGVYAFPPQPTPGVPPTLEAVRHQNLHLALLYQPMEPKVFVNNLPLALVAQQLVPNSRRFGEWFAEGMLRLADDGDHQKAVETIARVRPDLLQAALATRISKRQPWRRFVPDVLLLPTGTRSLKSGADDAPLTLHQLISRADNKFSQENAILLLAKALLSHDGIQAHLASGASAAEIYLQCSDWALLNALPAERVLQVSHIAAAKVQHEMYKAAPWVAEGKTWLYSLGRILRSAFTGDFDFTSNGILLTEASGKYSGIRSTSFNRRFSMLNSSKGMLDEPGPVTPWLSSFFSALLQWPGISRKLDVSARVGDVKTLDELREIIEARISVQRSLYASRSGTPVYVIPTSPETALTNRPMKVAVVQPMLPKRSEFNTKEPTRWSPEDMARHEQHLAQVCRLANHKVRSWESARKPSSASENGPKVDLIVFPELAVHPEHLSYLVALSDATGACIFAGLTFQHSDKIKGVVNQGLWLLRTSTPDSGRRIDYVWQGKKHPTKPETAMGVKGYRPHITLVEFPIGVTTPTRIAAAICYDSTDLDLLADLRQQSDMFVVSALNQDVNTFDNMVAALHFHMYQPVILANSGEFGGSTAQVPLPKHEKLVAHVHGSNQVAVSIFEVDPSLFKTLTPGAVPKELKTAPAGYTGRPAKI